MDRYTVQRGSSPLTRGKLDFLGCVHDVQRLIPAHAGKTGVSFVELQGAWAHPRSRGENASMLTPLIVARGSSPLTRGKPVRLGSGWIVPGLIPAHAGKTATRRRAGRLFRAHPRSRGENDGDQLRVEDGGGSSPLTRGKQGDPARVASGTGLIPAHAGKTLTV